MEEVFIVYVRSLKIENTYHTLPFDASYESGEDVIVHLSMVDKETPYLRADTDAQFLTTLGEIGKYTVLDDRAYNEKFPFGVPIDFAANEAK